LPDFFVSVEADEGAQRILPTRLTALHFGDAVVKIGSVATEPLPGAGMAGPRSRAMPELAPSQNPNAITAAANPRDDGADGFAGRNPAYPETFPARRKQVYPQEKALL